MSYDPVRGILIRTALVLASIVVVLYFWEEPGLRSSSSPVPEPTRPLVRPSDRPVAQQSTASQLVSITHLSKGKQKCATWHGALAYAEGRRELSMTADQCSEDAARRIVLDVCSTQNTDCHVTTFYGKACGALAYTSDGGWGANWGTDKEEAQSKAIKTCKKFNAREKCEVRAALCNGSTLAAESTPSPATPPVQSSQRHTYVPLATPKPYVVRSQSRSDSGTLELRDKLAEGFAVIARLRDGEEVLAHGESVADGQPTWIFIQRTDGTFGFARESGLQAQPPSTPGDRVRAESPAAAVDALQGRRESQRSSRRDSNRDRDRQNRDSTTISNGDAVNCVLPNGDIQRLTQRDCREQSGVVYK